MARGIIGTGATCTIKPDSSSKIQDTSPVFSDCALLPYSRRPVPAGFSPPERRPAGLAAVVRDDFRYLQDDLASFLLMYPLPRRSG